MSTFWKRLKKKPWFRIISNTYVLVLTVFVVWMVFFDTNSLLIHNELRRENEKLLQQKEFLEEQIARDKELIDQLSDPEELEKFAREQYFLKKKNEDIYIIELPDSLKTDTHERQ
jgi:cell division protein FtsB